MYVRTLQGRYSYTRVDSDVNEDKMQRRKIYGQETNEEFLKRIKLIDEKDTIYRYVNPYNRRVGDAYSFFDAKNGMIVKRENFDDETYEAFYERIGLINQRGKYLSEKHVKESKYFKLVGESYNQFKTRIKCDETFKNIRKFITKNKRAPRIKIKRNNKRPLVKDEKKLGLFFHNMYIKYDTGTISLLCEKKYEKLVKTCNVYSWFYKQMMNKKEKKESQDNNEQKTVIKVKQNINHLHHNNKMEPAQPDISLNSKKLKKPPQWEKRKLVIRKKQDKKGILVLGRRKNTNVAESMQETTRPDSAKAIKKETKEIERILSLIKEDKQKRKLRIINDVHQERIYNNEHDRVASLIEEAINKRKLKIVNVYPENVHELKHGDKLKPIYEDPTYQKLSLHYKHKHRPGLPGSIMVWFRVLPIDRKMIKWTIGKDGYYFKMFTQNNNLDFIWHRKDENAVQIWGKTKKDIQKAYKQLVQRIMIARKRSKERFHFNFFTPEQFSFYANNLDNVISKMIDSKTMFTKYVDYKNEEEGLRIKFRYNPSSFEQFIDVVQIEVDKKNQRKGIATKYVDMLLDIATKHNKQLRIMQCITNGSKNLGKRFERKGLMKSDGQNFIQYKSSESDVKKMFSFLGDNMLKRISRKVKRMKL